MAKREIVYLRQFFLWYDILSRAANERAKIFGKRGKAIINAHRDVYGEITWHHATYNADDNTAVMQLVKWADYETSLPHEGSVSQFEQEFDVKYSKKGGAVDISESKRWLSCK